MCIAPYHPQSNGLAERCVRIFKEGMKKIIIKGGSVEERIAKLLFNYRATPQSTTGITPGELMFGRMLMTRFDYVFPSITDKIEERQLKQKSYFDNKKRCHTFDVGDAVYVKNFHEGKK